jgi:hypothetical protein
VPWKMVQHVNYVLTRNRPIFPRILIGSAADTIIGWNDSTCWMIFSESCGRRRADVVETNRLHPHLFARTPGYLTIHGALARKFFECSKSTRFFGGPCACGSLSVRRGTVLQAGVTLNTEVQPIKIVLALARVSCARTFSNVALPK